jgi:transcriptional repressor NrdR
MQCPYCKETDLGVLESRVAEDGLSIRRRRRCNGCHKRFTTYERVEGIDMSVIKKDGTVQPFNREKIKRGLVKATWKRPVSMEDIEALVDEVEAQLRLRKSTTIRSYEIGKLVIRRLKKLDALSYLLFASVYNDFTGVEDFKREVDKLLVSPGQRKGVPA